MEENEETHSMSISGDKKSANEEEDYEAADIGVNQSGLQMTSTPDASKQEAIDKLATVSCLPLQYQNLSRVLSTNPLADSEITSSLTATDSVERVGEHDDGSVSVCVCGNLSTKGISQDDTQHLQVLYSYLCNCMINVGLIINIRTYLNLRPRGFILTFHRLNVTFAGFGIMLIVSALALLVFLQ